MPLTSVIQPNMNESVTSTTQMEIVEPCLAGTQFVLDAALALF